MQDVLIRMWLLRERWTDETELRRMALASVRNAALNVLRGHRHTEAIDLRLAETGPADDRNPLRDMEHKETEQRIAALIHDLPERGRAYLQMRAEGLSYNEIAVISGTSEVNVRSRVSRVRTWLLEQMRMRRI